MTNPNDECWCLRDRSFLGNTYIAPHCAYSWNPTYGPSLGFPQYIIEGNNAGTTLINPYQETQQAGSVLSGRTLVISGNIQNVGDITTPIISKNTKGVLFFTDNSNSKMMLGDGTNVIRFLNGSNDYRFSFDSQTNAFVWKPNGAGFGELLVTNSKSKNAQNMPLMANRTWLGRNGGIYFGGPNTAIAIIYGNDDPNIIFPNCSNYPAGSQYINIYPVNSNVNYVCICKNRIKPNPGGICINNEKEWVKINND
ncbi:MAG: hypothetical protein HC877_18970 [Thioploca sp.]|nr:hypothetical protein [Thioploca sp.]